MPEDLIVDFVFVPNGAPWPADWVRRHPDYITLPARMQGSPAFMKRMFGSNDGQPKRYMFDRPSASTRSNHEFVNSSPSADPPIEAIGPRSRSPSLIETSGPSAGWDAAAGGLFGGDQRQTDAESANAGASQAGVPLILPNGNTVWDPITKAPLISPVPYLRALALAARKAGTTYWSMSASVETADIATMYLGDSLLYNLGHGGAFDFQRRGSVFNPFYDWIHFPQFVHISNFNVGLFCQQAGFSLNEAYQFAGTFARFRSRNAKPDQPFGLDESNRIFIAAGFNAGVNGGFGAPAKPFLDVAH